MIEVCKELNFTSPVLVITGFGAGKSEKYLSFFMRTVISLFLKDQYSDKTRMENLITKSAIKWEIVRPGILINSGSSATYKILKELNRGMRVGKISRIDVADFLIKEAEDPQMLYQYVALTN